MCLLFFGGFPLSSWDVDFGDFGPGLSLSFACLVGLVCRGNFGNPLPLVGDDYSDEMRNREINNGRSVKVFFLWVWLFPCFS